MHQRQADQSAAPIRVRNERRVRQRPAEHLQRVLALQRSAGNAAVASMLGGRVVLQRDDNPAPVAGPAPAAGTTAGAPAAAAAPTGPVTVGFELTGGTMSGEALSNLVSGKSVSVGTGLGSATTETLTLSTA